MNPTSMRFEAAEIERLRQESYNATVHAAMRVHSELMVLRVRADRERPRFLPGQYTLLGLGVWEPRVDEVLPPDTPKFRRQPLLRRAYSISCPLLDERGRLVTTGDLDYIEFYIVLVTRPRDDPPMLTPRLFGLQQGDRLFLGEHAHGRYTLHPVAPGDTVIFAATGTGEAPHNAMIAELLAGGHRGRIVGCTCVRYRRDLAYLEVHRELERRFSNYRYFALTTREEENVDRTGPDYVGKQYLQDFVASGDLEQQAGLSLDPDRTHVYLCGNPDMIGLPHKEGDGHLVFPAPAGMVEVLVRRGFRLDQPHRPGTIHFEKYW